MNKEKRDGILDCAWLMDEVDIICVVVIYADLCYVLRKFIQLCFDRPPVESLLPVESEPFYIGQRGPMRPWLSIGSFVRKVCQRKLLLQALDFVIGDGDLEGGDGRHGEVDLWSLTFGFLTRAK